MGLSDLLFCWECKCNLSPEAEHFLSSEGRFALDTFKFPVVCEFAVLPILGLSSAV